MKTPGELEKDLQELSDAIDNYIKSYKELSRLCANRDPHEIITFENATQKARMLFEFIELDHSRAVRLEKR